MQLTKHFTRHILPAAASVLIVVSCMRYAGKSDLITLRQNASAAQQNARTILEKTTPKLAPGLELSLWATDSLAPDPVALTVDNLGRVYITRTNRQKNSEFDIRGHRDWMTPSIALQTVEDHRNFLHQTFAPEKSAENEWLKDLNFDGSHDWRDLTVEKEEVWRLEDTDRDGMADVSTRIVNDFSDEVSDIAAGVLVRDNDMFLTVAPDLWRLEDFNKKGIPTKKTSISHGYQVHIGFGGHNMSGLVEGPDGRIYFNMGDIGANVTAPDGKKWENPNSGFIARCNPDGSDFEIFATGLRNTHEFAFDEYGNLISSDNDGDHSGESERLVHVVEGSDAGWRSNWQYGKYTDPKNNGYNVWMDEKLSVPHWDGQAAYIIPPIMNYHNGPTGMVYNPGTALGSEWKNKFFLVEFVGTTTGSHLWSFGLKPKGASFELDGETDVLSGILPTGIQFGPDGALYIADWINGWGTKDYGRVWKLDVTKDKNDLAAVRQETQRLMQLNYSKQKPEMLYSLLFNADMRIRQKAQFELVNRGSAGAVYLNKAIQQKDNQLARVHGIWGMGQLSRKQPLYNAGIVPLLSDKDPEIVAQTAKIIGDAQLNSLGSVLIPLLSHSSPRVKFYAAEALGQLTFLDGVKPLIKMLETNNDQDLYIRHAGVLALARIGNKAPVMELVKSKSKALRTAAVLVLRRWSDPQVAQFLKDEDEYIVTEAARAINDDLSIPDALPALAATLTEKRFTSEALLRRAINAALRVGGENELQMVLKFASRTDINENVKAEALAAVGTWVNPSLTDRVDGRYRGAIIGRDRGMVQGMANPYIKQFLKSDNPEVLAATAGLLANLEYPAFNTELSGLFSGNKSPKVRAAALTALAQLKFSGITGIIKTGMEDADEKVRTTALGLLDNSNVSKESLPAIVQTIFSKGTVREQQQLLVVMGKLDREKTEKALSDLVEQLKNNKLAPQLRLELGEAIEASGSEILKAQLAAIKPGTSLMDEYADALSGGDADNGYGLFFYNSTAQCVRCHNVGGDGGKVGPSLEHIGSQLTREQILQALILPSERIAPGYGSVSITLKDGQQIFGALAKETAESLTITTSHAEPMIVPVARIAKRENLPSGMPTMEGALSKREIRDIVEFLAKQQ